MDYNTLKEEGPQPVGNSTEDTIVDGKPATVPTEVGPFGPPPKGEIISFWGPPVGNYSVPYEGTCYDLNDHYSMPRTFFDGKFFVRTPVEAGINLAAAVLVLGLIIYDVVAGGWGGVDWPTAAFKFIHFVFHVGVHIFANFSDEEGFEANRTVRAINGAIFGIARYLVIFIYAWRMGGPYRIWFILQLVVYVVLTVAKTEILGEVIKTTVSAVAIIVAMLYEGECSIAAGGVILGLIIQLLGTGRYWTTGYRKGWYGKWWLRIDDRATVPYHVLSDIGNVLILVCAVYTPGSAAGTTDSLVCPAGAGSWLFGA